VAVWRLAYRRQCWLHLLKKKATGCLSHYLVMARLACKCGLLSWRVMLFESACWLMACSSAASAIKLNACNLTVAAAHKWLTSKMKTAENILGNVGSKC